MSANEDVKGLTGREQDEVKGPPSDSAKNSLALATKNANEPKKSELCIASVLEAFLADIRSIQKAHSIVLPNVFHWLRQQHQENSKKLEKYRETESKEREQGKFVAKNAHQAAEMIDAIRALDGLGGMRIPETLQRSLFTQTFSEFDAFIGALLKTIYLKKGDLLKGISREISFADLLAYEDLNAVKLDMLEKEIDAFRRDSYVEQFVALEKKFGLKLRDFPAWREFVELSQRRNLLVHNGGVVSEQYLLICDRESHIFLARPNIGTKLEADPKYFARAIVVLSSVAFMLTHTLWRKVFPAEQRAAHEHANKVIYELLRDQRWKTSAEIAKFSVTQPMTKGIVDIDLRLRTINAAIAMKFSGDQAACDAQISSMDWSASYRDFKLAIEVLQGRFEAAAEYMRSIGKRGELVDELGYHQWPLFHKFRESKEFQDAYSEIYGVSFILEAMRKSEEAVESSRATLDRAIQAEDAVVKSKGIRKKTADAGGAPPKKIGVVPKSKLKKEKT